MTQSVSKMPVLFLAHGSPMNAIESNLFTDFLKSLHKKLPKPKAILMVSAHWTTEGTWVTRMGHPRTIHDFGGFPKELFQVQYPAPGSPALADRIINLVKEPLIHADDKDWGLDHGTWSVLTHLYPNAEVPVVQLSLDLSKPPHFHFELGHKLKKLREEGVLILASGNIVHNLRQILWQAEAKPYAWALEYNAWVKEKLSHNEDGVLLNEFKKSSAAQLSIPTAEHFLPLFYILGARETVELPHFLFEEIQNGSISMLTIGFGL